MHWFHTVSDIWQSPGNDHRHGIVDVGSSHFVLNINRYDVLVFSLSHMIKLSTIRLQVNKKCRLIKLSCRLKRALIVPLPYFSVLPFENRTSPIFHAVVQMFHDHTASCHFASFGAWNADRKPDIQAVQILFNWLKLDNL